jgi:hypothetical protein
MLNVKGSLKLILCAALATLPPLPVLGQAVKKENSKRKENIARPLAVQLTTDKETYTLIDKIKLRLCLMNVTMVPIYIYGEVDWGENASLSMWVQDATSRRELAAIFIADVSTPPPTSASAFDIVTSKQCHLIELTTELSEINITRVGIYEIVVSYHSPIPSSMSFGLPIVSRENGTFLSNPVFIKVR